MSLDSHILGNQIIFKLNMDVLLSEEVAVFRCECLIIATLSLLLT